MVLATWTGLEFPGAQSDLERVRDKTQAVYGESRCMSLEDLKHQVAHIQVSAIRTLLFDRFDFGLENEAPVPSSGSWVTGPERPCRLRYRHRSQGGVVL